MAKIAKKLMLVETVPTRNGGRFSLLNPNTGKVIPSDRPSVVTNDPFINHRVSLGHLSIVLDNLPEAATDAEYARYLEEAKGDRGKALEDFDLAMRALSAPPEKVVPPAAEKKVK